MPSCIVYWMLHDIVPVEQFGTQFRASVQAGIPRQMQQQLDRVIKLFTSLRNAL